MGAVKPAALALVALLAVLTLAIPGCGMATDVRMHPPGNTPFAPSALRKIFEEHSLANLVPAEDSAGMAPLSALTSGKADLAIVENSAAFVPGIRAILPIYESVLHVLIRDDIEVTDQHQSLKGASFYVVNSSEAGSSFVGLVTRRQGMEPGDYQLSYTFEPGITDVIVYFGPVDTDNTLWYQPGYRFASLNSRFNPQRHFYEEGVGYIAPNMRPKVIPALTYDIPGNDQPLLTVAVDALLVTRRDVPERMIFGVTKTLLEQKPRFTAVAPSLFSAVNESFDRYALSFPLHSGARRYLERDEPGLLERYAETINMLVYLIFLLLTSFLALARWSARRKKDRIDTFYIRVRAIEDRIGAENDGALLTELNELENEAFNSMIAEKLAADESFRIFTDLVARARASLSR
ncbi:MAG: TAXI family TRAP transporter solute-binding subunit [Halieaceae bacterium]